MSVGLDEVRALLGDDVTVQPCADGTPAVWIEAARLEETLRRLRDEVEQPYRMLLDLTAIDERLRENRPGQPASSFTLLYRLRSYERNDDLRLKVALHGDAPTYPSITPWWPAAGWYEREIWDMFGVAAEGHPNLRRILLPQWWEGHPLRKEYPCRATEMGVFSLSPEEDEREDEALRFRPEDWGLEPPGPDSDHIFLNMGPQHPGTHGPVRYVLELHGEQIINTVVDIGYHHRAAEKMGERQTWHTFIPYTDRVDYLSGVLNNLPYVMAVESLAGIEVPPRAQTIRVMMAELFRIASHLVWYGTFAQDLGAMSPVFYMFSDRERVFRIVEAVTGARMHPGWFRIGGVAQDLPEGWEALVKDFLAYLPARLRQYRDLLLESIIFRKRTMGVGALSLDDAISWGVTGPNLRACGLEWDVRKVRPYSGYEQFEFDVPTAEAGDCYARALVRAEELWQSLRIIRQCVEHMPEGPWLADHPVTTPPPKDRTLRDIETLIAHFLNVTWGPVVPPGEAAGEVESSKGNASYYLISDGGATSYRTRIRTPSFPHLQVLPLIMQGLEVADVVAILGSIDYVLADVDR